MGLLRNGDYAHAGGEEAINQVLKPFELNSSRTILDVGCGQGGTADFIHSNGWGQVSGFDIEIESVEYAKTKYPDTEFYHADVHNASSFIKKKFDLICLFNTFYAFVDQIKALTELRKLATNKTTIIIFDYLNLNPSKDIFLADNIKSIIPETIYKILKKSGWNSNDAKLYDITNDYKRWYKDLLKQLNEKKDLIVQKYSSNQFTHAKHRYSSFLEEIDKGNFGGAIVYATAS